MYRTVPFDLTIRKHGVITVLQIVTDSRFSGTIGTIYKIYFFAIGHTTTMCIISSTIPHMYLFDQCNHATFTLIYLNYKVREFQSQYSLQYRLCGFFSWSAALFCLLSYEQFWVPLLLRNKIPREFLLLSEEHSGDFFVLRYVDANTVFPVCIYRFQNSWDLKGIADSFDSGFPIGAKAPCWHTILLCKV